MWKPTGKFKGKNKGVLCLGLVGGLDGKPFLDDRNSIYSEEICGDCGRKYGEHWGDGHCPLYAE